MAEYKYACKECGQAFTISHPMVDKSPRDEFCPHCHSTEILRVWTPIPVHYRGHGFYATDVKPLQEYEQ